MSNYIVTTDFAIKDGLASGNTNKIIKGSEFAGEFNNIATASATKADLASPTFTGTVTIPTANIAAGAINATSLDLQNNEKIQLGDADQLEIYTDGTSSIIKETGSGALSLRGSEVSIKNPSGTETMAFFTQNGAASLYFDNAVKFATTATGNLSNGNLAFGDNHQIIMGVGNDLKLYHDGTSSFIEDSGAGNLKILTSSLLVKNPADDEFMIKGTPDGSVDLYYNNGKKLETTDTGAKVLGSLVAGAKLGVGIDAPLKPLHIFNAVTDVVARLESGDETAGLELIDATTTAQVKVANGLMTIGTDTSAAVVDSAISLRVDAVEKVRIEDDLVIIKDNARVNDNLLMSFGNGVDMSVSHVTATNTNTIQNNNIRPMVFNGVSFVFQNQGATEKLMELTANGAVDLYHNNNKKLETTATGIEVTGDVDMPDNGKVLIGDDDNLQLYYDGTDSLIEDTNSGNLLIRGVQLKLQSSAVDNADYITCTNDGSVALFNNGVQKANTFGWGFQVAGRIEVDTPSSNTDETAIFKKDGTNCGGVRTNVSSGVGDITLGSGVVGLRYLNAQGASSANISPTSVTDNSVQDDLIDLGRASARFDDIYATNGTINTSDANDKQSIEELTEAETRVAVACKGLVRKFKWNSAVEKKGSEARYHFGVIAQDVQSAFESEGLDAGDYGVFVSSTWEDENGVEQTRLGVRYTELLAFIIGGL